MTFDSPQVYQTYSDSRFIDSPYSFGESIRESIDTTAQEIKNFVASPAGQMIIGLGVGVCLHAVYGPLTERVVHLFGISAIPPDPFNRLGNVTKVLLSPVICVIGPVIEEVEFRGKLQGMIKDTLESLYVHLGCSDSTATLAARVTSLFFTAIIFGIVHFSNALVFWCNPVLFLPQVIAATIMGLIFGLAKEFSGDISMPIGMHIGNNTIAMGAMLAAS